MALHRPDGVSRVPVVFLFRESSTNRFRAAPRRWSAARLSKEQISLRHWPTPMSAAADRCDAYGKKLSTQHVHVW